MVVNNKIPQEIEDKIHIWECKVCGFMLRCVKPKECSCGYNLWFINSQAEYYYDRGFKAGQKQKVDDVLKLIDDWWANTMKISSTSTRLEELKAQIKNGGNDGKEEI